MFLPEDARTQVKYAINPERKSVSIAYNDTLSRSATYYGDCGCIIDTDGGLKFTPPVIQSSLPDAASQPWPLGDALEKVEHAPFIHSDSLQRAVALAFAPDSYTAAYLVIHNGEIIAERYDHGAHRDMQLESWSMGKSITALLTGRMIQQGYFKLDDPAPVPAWQQDGDPRKEIRIRDLLQMSSGLHFTAHMDPEADTYTQYLDHWYIYTGAIDAFTYSFSRPLQYPVGSTGRYRNCDPLTTGFIIRKTCEENGLNYHQYPQQHLFVSGNKFWKLIPMVIFCCPATIMVLHATGADSVCYACRTVFGTESGCYPKGLLILFHRLRPVGNTLNMEASSG
jgi:hypothetical protein